MRAAVSVFAASIIVYAAGHILEDSSLGLYEVAWHSEPSKIFLGSPSILRLRNGDLVVSVDRFGTGFDGQAANATLYRSTNNGTDWQFDAWITEQYWSNIFQLDDTTDVIYCLGTASNGPKPIKVHSMSMLVSYALLMSYRSRAPAMAVTLGRRDLSSTMELLRLDQPRL